MWIGGYGYKGKDILIHRITDANGVPVAVSSTPVNGDERQQVLLLLAQIRIATLKRGNRLRRPKTFATDIGYDARWLRQKLRTRGIRPQIKKRQRNGKKLKADQLRILIPLPVRALFLLVSTQIQTACRQMGTADSVF